MADQLSLPLSLRNEATFDNFLASAGSLREQVMHTLQSSVRATPGGEAAIYLWGAEGAGRSHLLQAVCHQCQRSGKAALYLPLDELRDFDPAAVLADLEYQPVVCLANIQTIATDRGWEEGVFRLYNRMREQGNLLLISADCAPRELPLTLADLQSRLAWSLVYHLPAYSDEEKSAILRFRAQRLGISLGEEVAAFILSRGERSLSVLMSCLERLDRASLSAGRRVTIPFVKAVFGW